MNPALWLLLIGSIAIFCDNVDKDKQRKIDNRERIKKAEEDRKGLEVKFEAIRSVSAKNAVAAERIRIARLMEEQGVELKEGWDVG